MFARLLIHFAIAAFASSLIACVYMDTQMKGGAIVDAAQPNGRRRKYGKPQPFPAVKRVSIRPCEQPPSTVMQANEAPDRSGIAGWVLRL